MNRFLIFSVFLSVMVFAKPTDAFSSDRDEARLLIGKDTIQGKIEKFLPSSIQFRSKGDKRGKIYETETVQGFLTRFGEYYKSLSIPDLGLDQPEFYLVLVEGHLSLYQSTESTLILKKDGKYYRLEKNDQLVQSGAAGIRKDLRYQGILRALTYDCNSSGDVSSLKFFPREIMEYIRDYNACKFPGEPSIINDYGKQLSFGIRFGVAQDYYQPVITGLFGGREFESVNSGFGGLVIRYSPRNFLNQRFSIQPEFLIRNKKSVLDFNNASIRAVFRNTYLQFPINFRYAIGDWKLQPSVSAGVIMGIAIDSENFITDGLVSLDPGFRNAEVGFNGGVGLSYKFRQNWVSLEYNYERVRINTIQFNSDFIISSHTISLTVTK